MLAHKSEPPRRVILFGCPGHNGWNTTTKGRNTREEKEAADVATLLERTTIAPSHSRKARAASRARFQWGNYGITGAGIRVATRNFLSRRRRVGIGIVDDSVSDMRFRGYCEDVNLTEACLLTIIM